MKKSLIAEIILFIILVSILAFFGVKIFKHTFDIGTTYHVAFKDIDSIVVGSPVRILGVDIGHVTKIQTQYDKIYVDFVVTNDNVKLPQGTTATIEFFGIAGSRSIELTPPAKDSEQTGIIIKEPIRIGDAFDIMSEFLRATMVSIAGMYEFAKNRTQEDAARDTAKFLKTTNEADDKIVAVKNQIESGATKLHSTLLNTTNGMNRLYNEAETLNISDQINFGKYAVTYTKRSMIRLHRDIKDFNKNMKVKTQQLNVKYQQIQNITDQKQVIDNIDKAFQELSTSLHNFDRNFTQENLDKVYDSFENIKLQSENLEKQI